MLGPLSEPLYKTKFGRQVFSTPLRNLCCRWRGTSSARLDHEASGL